MLDAHTLIWALDEPARLGKTALAVLSDSSNEPLLSASTIWELSIKAGLRKLTLSLPYREWMERAIADLGLTVVPITVEVAAKQMTLPWHHRDPFDRLLVAQCLEDNVPIVSADTSFDQYSVRRVWD